MDETEDITQAPKYWLPDRFYTFLKWLGLAALPTLSWGYQVLANIWAWPCANEVSTTLGVLGTLVAVLIGVSAVPNKSKNKPDATDITEE